MAMSISVALEGTDITDRVASVQIVMSRAAIHNEITVGSADPTLWPLLVDNAPTTPETPPETVTLDRYSWQYQVSGWALYSTNRWRVYVSSTVVACRFDMALGTEESSVAALNTAGEWYYDVGTQYLYVYATSNPGTLYTNPYPEWTLDLWYEGEVEYEVEHPDGWTAYGGQANTWTADWAAAPDLIWFDDYEGQEKTSIAGCTQARHWYYDAAAERIYVYSTTDPGSAYTTVDILTEYDDPAATLPEILKKSITVDLGDDTLSFYLERREGGERAFTFWGRSVSAAEEADLIGDQYTEVAATADAETTAAAMLTVRSLTWDADAVDLPAGWSFDGGPARGLDELARAMGLIVRADDAGDLVVSPHIPGMYPPYGEDVYPSGTADVTLDADDDIIDTVRYQEIAGEGHNAVTVSAPFTPATVVMQAATAITQYDTGLVVRLACTAAVYANAATRPEIWYSHGTAAFSTTAPYTAGTITITETVVFRNGQAAVTWPIKAVTAIGWGGASRSSANLGTIDYTVGDRTLQMTSGHAGTASVAYTTEVVYIACANTGGDAFYEMGVEPDSVAVGARFPDDAAAKTYQLGLGDRPAESVEDMALADPAAKSMRGRAVLRAAATRRSIIVETDVTERIRDGMIVQIDDAICGLSGQFWVESVTFTDDGLKQKYMMELCQCHP